MIAIKDWALKLTQAQLEIEALKSKLAQAVAVPQYVPTAQTLTDLQIDELAIKFCGSALVTGASLRKFARATLAQAVTAHLGVLRESQITKLAEEFGYKSLPTVRLAFEGFRLIPFANAVRTAKRE